MGTAAARHGGRGNPGGDHQWRARFLEENQKGSITLGKMADLVVLGRDPRRVEPLTLIDIPIERTMVGGRWAYES